MFLCTDGRRTRTVQRSACCVQPRPERTFPDCDQVSGEGRSFGREVRCCLLHTHTSVPWQGFVGSVGLSGAGLSSVERYNSRSRRWEAMASTVRYLTQLLLPSLKTQAPDLFCAAVGCCPPGTLVKVPMTQAACASEVRHHTAKVGVCFGVCPRDSASHPKMTPNIPICATTKFPASPKQK